jgi:hypothetical protein
MYADVNYVLIINDSIAEYTIDPYTIYNLEDWLARLQKEIDGLQIKLKFYIRQRLTAKNYWFHKKFKLGISRCH